ncbi:hypothetical protein Nepgr_031557 [Nepenthes gracilis]|uniref:CRM domain-containing protein n=1 Tax=Nepenthes gracilis TaxID=150966 RepID=A0AAD3Y772_NEPGR|nr:hypothetical protein Nepgr_031557 [Nepenthes gracilis]
MRGFRSLWCCIYRVASFPLHKITPSDSLSPRLCFQNPKSIFTTPTRSHSPDKPNALSIFRYLSYGSVNLVVSQGKLKFETHEIDPPKKEKWKTKKRLKLQRKREKQLRKAANTRDPRRLNAKGKKRKQKFANAEERIKYKIEKAKIKEALLVDRLKRYEVPKLQGPIVKPHELTGEERFYLKKMAQKGSNYVPVGRRGIFGGVILNMHMHWKKHETVKVFCKPCKSGQVQEYAQEIARLSGGIPIQIIGDDTIIFYRGKDYVQPEIMSPIDTLSKKRALEKSKYEQSLEAVRHFITVAEKELELYYRHIALYSNPANTDNSKENLKDWGKVQMCKIQDCGLAGANSSEISETETCSSNPELLEPEDEFEDEGFSLTVLDSDNDYIPEDETESDCEDQGGSHI